MFTKRAFYPIAVMITMALSASAYAGCDGTTDICSDTKINSLLMDEIGNIYVGIGADMNPLSCVPFVQTIDPETGTQRRYLTILSGTQNRDMMHTLLKILHEQQRFVAGIKVADSGACEIQEIHSEF